MRKRFVLYRIACWSFAVVFLAACQKNADTHDNPTNPLITKLYNWLDAKKSAETPNRNAGLENLKEHLEIESVKKQEFKNGEELFVIPFKPGFKSTMNKDKHTVNNLLVFVDNTGEIRRINVVQFIPANETINAVPDNTFSNYFKSKPIEVDGKFVFLSVFDKPKYEMDYSDGSPKSLGVYELKPTTQNQSQRGLQCIEYWLVTTTHMADITITTREYLYTRCYDNEVQVPQGDEGGGGGDPSCCPDGDVSVSMESSSEQDSITCGPETISSSTGNPVKTCTYKWTFSRNSMLSYNWKYKSIETGELEKVNGSWKFKSFSHTGNLMDGQFPPCISSSCQIAAATPSITSDGYQARMNIHYSVTINITCCFWCSPNTRSMQSGAMWIAS